jgi:hypothetical protein
VIRKVSFLFVGLLTGTSAFATDFTSQITFPIYGVDYRDVEAAPGALRIIPDPGKLQKACASYDPVLLRNLSQAGYGDYDVKGSFHKPRLTALGRIDCAVTLSKSDVVKMETRIPNVDLSEVDSGAA